MRELPSLGLGTAPIGNLYRPVSDRHAADTLHAALDAGLRFFDTAPHYGFGLAEQRLGRALAGVGDAIVSTKVGRLLVPADRPARERHGFVDARPFEPVFDYSADAVRRSLDGSLVRLARDGVDLLLAHDLGALTHGDRHDAVMRAFLDGGYPAMRRLKEQGVAGAIGIGVNEVAVCLDLLDRVELDVILLAGRYSLLDRSAACELLPRARALGVKVVIGGPYNSGILARPLDGTADARYDYAPADAGVLARARAVEQTCARFGVAMPAAALQFPLLHPAVAAVVAGLGGPGEVADATARLAARVPDALWAALDGVAEAA